MMFCVPTYFPQVTGYDSYNHVVEGIRDSSIVIGIPSRNTAHTVGYVLHTVSKGLEKYYNDVKVSIIVCDGLSDDGTVEIVKTLRNYIKQPVFIVPNLRAPGKGAAMRTIIELVSQHSNAEVLVFLDSDLRSITPEWIPLLAETARKYGYATPLYRRHKFDATITNFIARPITSTTYGIDIRQPIGGDFGLSRRLVDILAESPLWTSNPWTQLFGVDIFITHTALAHNISVGEALLKVKIHEAKDPTKGLRNMFIEVTGSLFIQLVEYQDYWKSKHVDKLVTPPVVEKPEVPDTQPWEVKVNPENALKAFHKGLEEHKDIYKQVFSSEVFSRIYSDKIAIKGIESELWATILLEAYRYFKLEPRITKRKYMLEALFSLWQGRLYEYYNSVWSLTTSEVEKIIEKEVKTFFSRREELVSI